MALYAFVISAGNGAGVLRRVDLTTGSSTTLSLGDAQTDIAYDGTSLYVSSANPSALTDPANRIDVINPDTMTVTDSYATSGTVLELLPYNGDLFATRFGSSGDIIKISSGSIVGTFSYGTETYSEIIECSGDLFVASQTSSNAITIRRIDTAGTSIANITTTYTGSPTTFPQSIATDGSTVFLGLGPLVATSGADRILYVSASTNTVTTDIDVQTQLPFGAPLRRYPIKLTADGADTVWGSQGFVERVMKLDVGAGTLTQFQPVPATDPTLAATGIYYYDGSVYVCGTSNVTAGGTSSITVHDPVSDAQTASYTFALSGASDLIVLDLPSARGWVVGSVGW